jgi:hypothetical protein
MDAVSMDTQADVEAREAAAREASRQRTEELLADVERTLATPRDPEVVRRAAEGEREHQRRRAEERAAEAARAAREYVPPPVQKAAPAPAAKPVAYVTKNAFREYQNGIEAAVARFVKKTEAETLARSAWRTAEAERRIADLEARLAKLESKADG